MVRVAALRTLVALSPVEGVEQLYPYLQHPDPQLRLASVASLLQYGGVEVTMLAERELLQWATSTNPAERIQAAQVIGEAKSRNLSSLLESLLQDEALEVRRAALLSAGQAGYPQLWPQVIATLAQRQLRSVAGVSLATGGENSLAAIRVALQAEPPHEILIRLLRVCSRIESEGATALLLAYLASPDDRVRSQAVTALERRNYRAAPSERASLQQRIEAEISFATTLLGDMVGLAGGTALPSRPWGSCSRL
jgi:HEAT repeat protein